jgi:hypothetical protein
MTELEELEWAEKVTISPDEYTEEERHRAEQLLSEPSPMWQTTMDELDDILDIEDDGERELAFERWEAANVKK